jgi:N-acetyl-1-D-myo-inositol-2-amino-2-deoxy-alpha-D-glucopyranoside deacetylase
MDIPRLLFVHAHPDDESLTTGATIAHYAARGASVHVVTCTLGEEGEVIGERWAQLAVAGADQLGGYRVLELSAALNELGVGAPSYLGGAGRWRDSGMAGGPARHPRSFVDADPDEAVGALVAVIRELRPHVVVSYDPNGGYGHPDHIQAHRVTTAAVAAAGSSEHPGDPWPVPKLYWTVMARTALAEGIGALAELALPPNWRWADPADFQFTFSDDEIDAVIDAPEQHDAKVAALRAHATQVSVEPSGRACALSNELALPIVDSEHYVLAAGPAGERDARGWETDLLAGLKLG